MERQRMKKVLIWGTGKVAKQLLLNGINAEVTGFVETKKTAEEFNGSNVYEASNNLPEYDYLIVANTFASEVYHVCIEHQIDLNKVIFLYGVKKQEGVCNLTEIREILGEKNYINYCGEFGLNENTFFEEDMQRYMEQNHRPSFAIQEKYLWPVIKDKYAMAGTINNYFWQDLWAARLIYKTGVRKHFDIGSRIDGFIAHLLSMDMDVTLIDIREFPGEVENLHTIVDDATTLRQIPDNSIESMSALCSLEHFGLGRYGDPIDSEACFRCFEEIQKKVKKDGNLYISLPIGKERVEFNAHRVFYASTILQEFHQMELVEFSCTAEGKIEYNVDIHKYDKDTHDGNFRYGLFHFVKK